MWLGAPRALQRCNRRERAGPHTPEIHVPNLGPAGGPRSARGRPPGGHSVAHKCHSATALPPALLLQRAAPVLLPSPAATHRRCRRWRTGPWRRRRRELRQGLRRGRRQHGSRRGRHRQQQRQRWRKWRPRRRRRGRHGAGGSGGGCGIVAWVACERRVDGAEGGGEGEGEGEHEAEADSSGGGPVGHAPARARAHIRHTISTCSMPAGRKVRAIARTSQLEVEVSGGSRRTRTGAGRATAARGPDRRPPA